MTKKVSNIVFITTVMLIFIIGIASFFVIIDCNTKKEIKVRSFDGVSELVIEKDDNVTNVENDEMGFNSCVKVACNSKDKFIYKLKSSPYYYKTFKYDNSTYDSIVLLCNHYYYIVDFSDKTARIRNLCVEMLPCIVPYFNSTADVKNTVYNSVDEFNSYYNTKMKKNAFNTYEELKDFYQNMNSDFYICDDEKQEIGVKIYTNVSSYKNGTQWTTGYYFKIKFEERQIILSLNEDYLSEYSG